MPITFHPAKKDIKAFESKDYGRREDSVGSQAERILKGACYEQYRRADEILQSSFDTFSRQSQEQVQEFIPMTNGFVHTVLEAYNNHRALVIRPDDVWLAILIQFNVFINGNAEALRSQFVQHEGKKELTVTYVGDVRKVDYGELAHKMTIEIEKNVTDPVLRHWILPDFSTTETNDTIVCSIVMMATMKEYFSYKFMLLCGIPKVTLQGEKEDWEKILSRLEKLKEYGLQTIAWYHLLHPVISRFVRAFDAPDAQENLDFWQQVCHYEGGGSGPTWLSGWITAFCVFDLKGAWMGNKFKENSQSPNPASLPTSDFFFTFLEGPPVVADPFGFDPPREPLQLDGALYHRIDDNDVPAGSCEVDVLVVDASSMKEEPREVWCLMVAGQVGMRLSSSCGTIGEGGPLNADDKKDTVQPVAGWWMFTKLFEGEYRDERVREGSRQSSFVQGPDDALDRPDPDEMVAAVIELGQEPKEVRVKKEHAPELASQPQQSQQSQEKEKEEPSHGAGCCKCVLM